MAEGHKFLYKSINNSFEEFCKKTKFMHVNDDESIANSKHTKDGGKVALKPRKKKMRFESDTHSNVSADKTVNSVNIKTENSLSQKPSCSKPLPEENAPLTDKLESPASNCTCTAQLTAEDAQLTEQLETPAINSTLNQKPTCTNELIEENAQPIDKLEIAVTKSSCTAQLTQEDAQLTGNLVTSATDNALSQKPCCQADIQLTEKLKTPTTTISSLSQQVSCLKELTQEDAQSTATNSNYTNKLTPKDAQLIDKLKTSTTKQPTQKNAELPEHLLTAATENYALCQKQFCTKQLSEHYSYLKQLFLKFETPFHPKSNDELSHKIITEVPVISALMCTTKKPKQSTATKTIQRALAKLKVLLKKFNIFNKKKAKTKAIDGCAGLCTCCGLNAKPKFCAKPRSIGIQTESAACNLKQAYPTNCRTLGGILHSVTIMITCLVWNYLGLDSGALQ